ncbi:hypothetical protein ACFUT3_29545, partial [Streptomyces cinereoruber]|uniref:hypothetical protein n=1 Tax=Streptomyces cinereoruber TaxID=67260 RepID=UPI0036270C58
PTSTRPTTTLNTSPNRRLEPTHRASTRPGAVHLAPPQVEGAGVGLGAEEDVYADLGTGEKEFMQGVGEEADVVTVGTGQERPEKVDQSRGRRTGRSKDLYLQ